jgi:hypothetical protein
MACEKKDFRDNLERIAARFGKELLSVREVADFLGIGIKNLNHDRTFPQKKVGGRYYITAVALAKWMS